jgi:hypothetical protein
MVSAENEAEPSSFGTDNVDKAMKVPRTDPSVLRDRDLPKEAMQLLTVPFYIYEELIWHNATVAGKALDDFIAEAKRIKHFDDYYFVQAALKHPMRVPNPAQAKLFVVP